MWRIPGRSTNFEEEQSQVRSERSSNFIRELIVPRGISMVSWEEVIVRDFGSQAGITIRNLHSAVLCYDVYLKTRIAGEVCLFVKNDQGEICEIAEVKDFRRRLNPPNRYMIRCQPETALST